VELLKPFDVLPSINAPSAIKLVRAARLYQDALWLAESQPQLSWLLMVSALESAALCWRSSSEDPALKLEVSKPELFEYLSGLADKCAVFRVAKAFKDSFGLTRKFMDFVMAFRPPEPTARPKAWLIDWSDKSLKKILKDVYHFRSQALHAGKPFPAPMCIPPLDDPTWAAPSERPVGHTRMGGGTWLEEDTPIVLHTFEYITRGALLNWWNAGCPIEKTQSAENKKAEQ
jgi:hypothetical protein